MKQPMCEYPINNSPIPLNVTANVKITLTNKKTGEVEVIEKHNMQTNGLAKYLTNCGWMNSDNLTKSNLVKQCLGGIMLFDDEITENADNVTIPAGLNMVANGACEVTNGTETGDPSEMGNWIQEGESGSGWKEDGSYHLIWEWGLDYGNGTIASACLTSKQSGWGGDGNSTSNARKPSSTRLELYGSATTHTIKGVPCKLSVSDSSIYGIDLSDTTNKTITIRKYRLPLTKANLKGTPSEPVMIGDAVTITMPDALQTQLLYSGYTQAPTVQNMLIQDNGETLIILSANQGLTEWGNGYDQTMWEIDPVAGTCTASTIPNNYSVERTMYSMREPVWFDRNTVAWINGYYGYVHSQLREIDIIYSMKRTNGTWGSVQECSNSDEWNLIATKYKDGRALIYRGYPYNNCTMFDYEKNKVYNTNFSYPPVSDNQACTTDEPLIYYKPAWNDSISYNITVYRDQRYMATIWNADAPYSKTAEKFMRVDYVLTFDEEEGTSTSTSS